MTSAGPDSVLVEAVGGVLVVTINRPEARNAVDLAVARGIAAAMDRFDQDDDLVVGVLTGVPGSFCAGMDLRAFLRGERPRVEGRGFAGLVERPPLKPLVAAVDGPALAGGFELALACDLLVASTAATFALPEVRRGLIASAGGSLRLPRALPRVIATEMLLTGASRTAAELAAHGLVNRLVAPGTALAAAMELAGEIAANAPLAVRATKQVLAESDGWATGERFARLRNVAAAVLDSDDAREGAAAFAERRTPVWTAT